MKIRPSQLILLIKSAFKIECRNEKLLGFPQYYYPREIFLAAGERSSTTEFVCRSILRVRLVITQIFSLSRCELAEARGKAIRLKLQSRARVAQTVEFARFLHSSIGGNCADLSLLQFPSRTQYCKPI